METVPEAYSADCARFEDISEILNLPLYPGFEPGSKVDTSFSELLLHFVHSCVVVGGRRKKKLEVLGLHGSDNPCLEIYDGYFILNCRPEHRREWSGCRRIRDGSGKRLNF